jgi:ribosomal protein L35
MNSGSVLAGRPSLGSWSTYGLGSENENLPSFVVLLDNPRGPVGGVRNWGPGFLPAVYQGTQFKFGEEPISHLNPKKSMSRQRQLNKLRYLSEVNRKHAEERAFETQLDSRINAYELAFRMQAEAPGVVDLGGEAAHVQAMYGIGEKATDAMGKNCLLARRLVERGVRFVQIYCGSGSKWDSHDKIEEHHTQLCLGSDKPVAGLIQDLKQRGLLDETLVVWGGEFGRSPMSEKGDGRDHNPTGFTMWMAGGGVKGGQAIGTTDELGLRAVEDRVHVHDLHATILHLMGLHHMKLNYLHNGRLERPTINEGEVVTKVMTG